MTGEHQFEKQIYPRVLIVENDEMNRLTYRALIKHWEYDPVVVEGDGKVLLENAKTRVKEQRCQLAIVDMRLLDDFDDRDKSGLNLIQKLKPAMTIMVSGRGDLADVRKSAEGGAVGFVGKEEGPETLRERLDSEAQKLCAQKKSLVIEPVEVLEHLSKTLFANIPEQFHDQLTDAFLRLFPEAQRLRVEKLGTSHISSDFLTVPRPRSVILRVREDNKQPVIIKLARIHKTKIEIDNFKNYIDGQLYGNFVPVLKGTCLLWDIGGVKFSYVGTIDQTFSNFFKEQRLPKIKQCLTSFFTKTWQPHYQQPVEVNNISLFEMYCEVWDRDWVERIENFRGQLPDNVLGPRHWEKVAAPNPLEWLKENIFHGKDLSVVEKTKKAVTHGDLHGDNMLVDDSNNIWVVDFERTKQGHILQDFIELEADLINRLPCSNENFPAFLAICAAISKPVEITKVEVDEVVRQHPEVEKALLTISHLRQLARDCTGISDARQYLIGLLFNTVFRATIATSAQRQQNQQRALMLASILCHRLEHWGEPWPPEIWREFFTQQEKL